MQTGQLGQVTFLAAAEGPKRADLNIANISHGLFCYDLCFPGTVQMLTQISQDLPSCTSVLCSPCVQPEVASNVSPLCVIFF